MAPIPELRQAEVIAANGVSFLTISVIPTREPSFLAKASLPHSPGVSLLIRRQSTSRRSWKFRSLVPDMDLLETRQLLSVSASLTNSDVAHPLYELSNLVRNTSPPSGAYTPSQIARAYGFDQIAFGSLKGDGTGQTIAIVNAYDNPYIQSDLDIFSAQFGIASTTITKVNQSGGTTMPASDPTGGSWALETALDVEWAHAMAPGASILLVAANSSSVSDLLTAVNYASAHASVVSMSWGASEFNGETTYDSYFSKSGVAFVTASGDTGAPASWPSASPNVLTVGGTALTLTATGTYSSETGWSGSGGGPSLYETQPSYQKGVVTQTTTKRATPDVSYDASPSTGFAVYSSYLYSGTSYGWLTVGGTSAGSPQWASLIAIADQGRALSGLAPLNSTSAQELQNTLYANPSAFHDITSGTSTGTTSYTASAGYDYVTGLGSPYANLVVTALVGSTTVTAKDSLVISTPTSTTAGNSFMITVSAKTLAGVLDPSFRGSISFSSSDLKAVLPAVYTFTAADNGTHTFTITLKTSGSQSITATDTTASATSATASRIVVSAAAASRIAIASSSTTATAGTPKTFTVTAYDPYGNVAISYAGTVVLTSSDALASLRGAYTYTTADKGTHTFSVTFKTVGSQSVTASDSASGFSSTLSSISVSPAAPTNLLASVVSSSQINLSWTGVSGATGYIIQRSMNGSSGWSQIGTTAATQTSYSNTGLTANKTYYYRVQAIGGAFSAVVSAKTLTKSSASTASSLWTDSYTPYENAYSVGSYEVGVKFTSSVEGTVTGIRFYKQSWMNGFLHVGHLWSSTGTLLATATFTGETFSGWQQVDLSTPVAITANSTYIVSFSTGGGYFGVTTGFFSGGGATNSPLQIPAIGSVYGASGAFPSINGAGMNFWADVAFSPVTTPATTLGTAVGSKPKGITVMPSGTSTTTGGQPQSSGTASPRYTVVTGVSFPTRKYVNQATSTTAYFSRS